MLTGNLIFFFDGLIRKIRVSTIISSRDYTRDELGKLTADMEAHMCIEGKGRGERRTFWFKKLLIREVKKQLSTS